MTPEKQHFQENLWLNNYTPEQLEKIKTELKDKIDTLKKDGSFSGEDLKELVDLLDDKTILSPTEKELKEHLEKMKILWVQIDFLMSLVWIEESRKEEKLSNNNTVQSIFRAEGRILENKENDSSDITRLKNIWQKLMKNKKANINSIENIIDIINIISDIKKYDNKENSSINTIKWWLNNIIEKIEKSWVALNEDVNLAKQIKNEIKNEYKRQKKENNDSKKNNKNNEEIVNKLFDEIKNKSENTTNFIWEDKIKSIISKFVEDEKSLNNFSKIVDKISFLIVYLKDNNNEYINKKINNIKSILDNLENQYEIRESEIKYIELEGYDIAYEIEWITWEIPKEFKSWEELFNKDIFKKELQPEWKYKEIPEDISLDEAIALLEYTNRNFEEIDDKWVRTWESRLSSLDNEEEIQAFQEKLTSKIHKLLQDESKKYSDYSLYAKEDTKENWLRTIKIWKWWKNEAHNSKEIHDNNNLTQKETVKSNNIKILEKYNQKIDEKLKEHIQNFRETDKYKITHDVFSNTLSWLEKLSNEDIIKIEYLSNKYDTNWNWSIELNLINKSILADIIKNKNIKINFDKLWNGLIYKLNKEWLIKDLYNRAVTIEEKNKVKKAIINEYWYNEAKNKFDFISKYEENKKDDIENELLSQLTSIKENKTNTNEIIWIENKIIEILSKEENREKIKNLPDYIKNNPEYINILLNNPEKTIDFRVKWNKISDYLNLTHSVETLKSILSWFKYWYNLDDKEKNLFTEKIIRKDEANRLKYFIYENQNSISNLDEFGLQIISKFQKDEDKYNSFIEISKETSNNKEIIENNNLKSFLEKYDNNNGSTLTNTLKAINNYRKEQNPNYEDKNLGDLEELLKESTGWIDKVDKKIKILLDWVDSNDVKDIGENLLKMVKAFIEEEKEKLKQDEKNLWINDKTKKEYGNRVAEKIEKKLKEKQQLAEKKWLPKPKKLTEEEIEEIKEEVSNEFAKEQKIPEENKDNYKETLKKSNDLENAEKDVEKRLSNTETYINYLRSWYEGSLDEYAIEKRIPLKNEKWEIINAKEIWLVNNQVKDYKEFDFNPENNILKTKNWESIYISKEEANKINSNPEIWENIINLYNSLKQTWLTKLWQFRENIFKSVENISNGGFERDDWNYFDERETKILFNAILVSVWEKPLKTSVSVKSFLEQIENLNGRQITWNEKEVNLYWDTRIESLFIKKFVPRWDLIWFKQSEFEKSLRS